MMVRQTSLKTYDEIKEEGIYDTDMAMVYDAIKNFPLMTAREYCTLILKYEDQNKVRPRVSDLKKKGAIIEVGKRKCICSGRTSIVWSTLEGAEKVALRRVGFKEDKSGLFVCEEDGVVCYQDFRKGKRRSYVSKQEGMNLVLANEMSCYKKFKEELTELLDMSSSKDKKTSSGGLE